MRVTPGMKRIQIKSAMTKTHCNSERKGSGEVTSNDLSVITYIQESSLFSHNLFPPTSKPFFV